MKNSIKITGDYESSNSTFTGTEKETLKFLRKEALKMRKDSRSMRNLPNTVHAISAELHQSKLVTMASFAIKRLGIDSLIELINSRGVLKYTIEK
jgi:hypothetical protein